MTDQPIIVDGKPIMVGGKPFTQDMAEALAAEAEAGYRLDQLEAPGELFAPLGVTDEPVPVVVHLPGKLVAALTNRAAATHHTRDELVALAVEELLTGTG